VAAAGASAGAAFDSAGFFDASDTTAGGCTEDVVEADFGLTDGAVDVGGAAGASSAVNFGDGSVAAGGAAGDSMCGTSTGDGGVAATAVNSNEAGTGADGASFVAANAFAAEAGTAERAVDDFSNAALAAALDAGVLTCLLPNA
jgi:hypothetical protein